MSRLDQVEARRAALVARAEEDRAAIAASVVALERPMTVAGRVLAVVRFVRANPFVIVGALALVMLIGRRRRPVAAPVRVESGVVWVKRLAFLDLLRRGFFLWRSSRRILRVSASLLRLVR